MSMFDEEVNVSLANLRAGEFWGHNDSSCVEWANYTQFEERMKEDLAYQETNHRSWRRIDQTSISFASNKALIKG
jgi:hypothetical protein